MIPTSSDARATGGAPAAGRIGPEMSVHGA